MIASRVWLSLLLLASAAAMTIPTSYRGSSMYRVTFAKEQKSLLDLIRNCTQISVSGETGHGVYVVTVPAKQQDYFRETIQRLNVSSQLLIPDIEKVFQLKHNVQWKPVPHKTDGSSISFSKYYRHDEIRKYLLAMEESYPIRVAVETIGHSFEDRPIDIIKISSGGDGARPVILMDAGIHAREWIAPAAALYVINQLVENGAKSSLVDHVDWHIIPVLNPDGYEYTFTTDRMWRKTRSFNDTLLCRGVDANRNFDFHWNEIGTSGSSCGDDFAGQEPFSEPETRALRDYVLRNADRIKMYLTLHSHGGFILYPWGYTNELTDDWKTLHALAEAANEAQVAAGGEDFVIGSSSNALYPVSGSSEDWMKGVAGVPLSYVIELPAGGRLGFDPPESDIIGIVKPVFESVWVFGQYVAANYR